MGVHTLRHSPKIICVVVGFFHHFIRPEIGMEKVLVRLIQGWALLDKGDKKASKLKM